MNDSARRAARARGFDHDVVLILNKFGWRSFPSETLYYLVERSQQNFDCFITAVDIIMKYR